MRAEVAGMETPVSTIYTKTPKGLRESVGKTRDLSEDLRDLLELCKGLFTVEDISAQIPTASKEWIAASIAELVAGGYLRDAPEVARKREEEVAGGGDLDSLDFSKPDPAAARKAAEQARLEAEKEKARLAAEEKARREAEEKIRREAEEKVRRELEEKVRIEAEKKARIEAEEKARRAAEEKIRREAEEKVRRELEEKARREAEEKAKLSAEERARREAEEKIRREAEEKVRREFEEKARIEAEKKARIEAEEKARRDAEEKVRREIEEKARREAEEKARIEAEARARREAEERAKREAEEKIRLEAEEKVRREQDEKARRERREKARREEEERIRREAEEKARREEEERIRREEEEKARLEAAEKARREAVERARREVEERARREAEEKARLEAEEKARLEAEEKARREEEERIRREAEEKVRREIEEKARREAEEKARIEAEERARREAEEKARREEEERIRREAEEKARRKAEEKARLEAEEKARLEQEERDREAIKERIRLRGEKRRRLILPLVFGLLLPIAVAALLLQVLSFDGKRAEFEKTATGMFGVPVKVGSAKLGVLGGLQWLMNDVAIGGEGDTAKIARVRLGMSLSGVFGGPLRFESIHVDAPQLPPALALKLLGQAADGTQLKSGQVRVTGLTFNGDQKNIPALDLRATFEDGRLTKISGQGDNPESGKFSVTMDRDDKWHLTLSAAQARWLVGTNLTLTDVALKGDVAADGMQITEFSAALPSGDITGNGKLSWQDGWRVSAKLEAKRVDAARLAPGWIQEGSAAGNALLFAESGKLGELFSRPKLSGSFSLARGALRGIDLDKVLQDRGQGEQSRFETLNGEFLVDSGRIDLTDLKLAAQELKAAGSLGFDANRNASGRLVVEAKSAGVRRTVNLRLSGTLAAPNYQR
jgi:hypothetical protein